MIKNPNWHEEQIDFNSIYREMIKANTPMSLDIFAERLGVETLTLQQLGCVWSREHWAWAFPMSDKDGVCGIRLVCDNGQKFVMPGSRYGSFTVMGGIIDDEVQKIIKLLDYK